MTNKNDEFLKRLLAMFRVEADEHLAAMSSGLIELEKAPASAQRAEIVEKIFREAHSLKGAARAVNLAEIESLSHSLESVFAGLKSNVIVASLPLFDLVHQALDALGGLLATDARSGADKMATAALMQKLDETSKAEPLAQATSRSVRAPHEGPLAASAVALDAGANAPVPSQGVGPATIRVHTAKLAAVMRQTEELLAPRLAAGQRTRELHEVGATLTALNKQRVSLQPALRAVEQSLAQSGAAKGQRELGRLLEYLAAEKLLLKSVEDRLAKLEWSAQHDHRALNTLVDGLLHDVKEMHMLPFSSLLDALPRVARELASAQGKQVDLVVRGGEIEIDRRILEQLKDPLNHLLRNGIDHGIEKPALREHKGKPRHGILTIAVAHKDSSKVEIVVADDGTGIEVAKVKAAAGRLGLVPAEELGRLGEREALALIFRSGFSTSSVVTDLSGRGLGLAIARERVEQLRGTIVPEPRPGGGAVFRIVLPLTLATFRGVLVRAGDQTFIIPAVSVERVARIADTDIRTVENRETVPLDGKAVSLVRLSDVLAVPRAKSEPAEKVPVVVLGVGLDRVAFRVDAVLEEQEVLVKGLGRQLARVRNLAGACVLVTGRVVPVLNVSDLMKSAMRPDLALAPVVAEDLSEKARRSVLVVEDSITSRTLLMNILESAGYRVATAVDGLDAYTTLKTGVFDLVVSDVEMPRMDGFDLTSRIRADKQLSELPVVLVTALESREHRERGIDVGANAYIVKSSFDQSNLLETIGRLI